MWKMICGLVLCYIAKLIFDAPDIDIDLDSSQYDVLFAVAKRLEKLYLGCKVFVGLQIPDPDSGSRQSVDIVLVTDREVSLISVQNVSGIVFANKEGCWVSSDPNSETTRILSDPVAETKRLVLILEEYLERRGVILPDGYLSFKIICPNPQFSDLPSRPFPPGVITYNQWAQLKPVRPNSYSGWFTETVLRGKNKMQEPFLEKLCSVLCTAPIWDRLGFQGDKHILGEFLGFRGKQEDLQLLAKIKRSKVSHVRVQKTSIFNIVHSKLHVLYTPRDYRHQGASSSPSELEQVTVSSSTEVVFQPRSSPRQKKCKLSSLVYMSLSV